MNFYMNVVVPNKKINFNKEKAKRLILSKEVLNVIEEKTNFPREFPKPISLAELTKYYSIRWSAETPLN